MGNQRAMRNVLAIGLVLAAALCYAGAMEGFPGDVIELGVDKGQASLAAEEEEHPLWTDFKAWRKEYNSIMREIKATPLHLEIALGKIHPDKPEEHGFGCEGEECPAHDPLGFILGARVDANGRRLLNVDDPKYPHKESWAQQKNDYLTKNYKPTWMSKKDQQKLLRAELIDLKKQQRLIHVGAKPKKFSNMDIDCEKEQLKEIDYYYSGQRADEKKLGEGVMTHEEMKDEIIYREAQFMHVRNECMPHGMTNKNLAQKHLKSNMPIPYPAHYDAKSEQGLKPQLMAM